MMNNLQSIRAANRLTQADIAERLGVSVPQVSRWETGKDNIPSSRLPLIAEAYSTSIAAIFGDPYKFSTVGPMLFVKGAVAAGVWKEAFEFPQTEWVTFSGRADYAIPASDRFGLRVEGESMNMLYPHGSIVECATLGSAAPLVSGRRVVVVRENEAGDVEATVKEYVDRDGTGWLWPRSSHPDFQQPWQIDSPPPGIIRVTVIAVVVASIRPE